MTTFEQLRELLTETLQLGERGAGLTPDSRLLGAIPEFDSMAVLAVITALEDRLDIRIDDEDISADTFDTLGTLVSFIDSKR